MPNSPFGPSPGFFNRLVFSQHSIAGLTALLLAASASLPSKVVAQNPDTPESFFGHPVGADYHLTTYEQAMAWFHHLADHSAGRMEVHEMGTTGMGRLHEYAVISSRENLERFEEFKAIARRLSLAEDIGASEAETLAGEGKAIAWIDVGLHSTEAAPSEHALQLAYDLVVGEDEATRRVRENVITLLVFPNPDGMTMVADWYMEHVGTEFEESRMPWLYNRYIGHDNNRDSYNVSQAEVRNVSRLQNQVWFPNVVYNHHQTAPFPTRIWIPPYGEPANPNKPGEVIRWENLIGAAMGMAFEAEGKPGAVSRVSFDAWYPGFMTQVVTHHNIPSILTETALHYLATPREYTLEDIPEAWRDFQKSAFYTTPWEGGWWRIGDAVEYCLTASKAVLDVTARYRKDMLLSKYRLARANMDRFEVEGPFGWALPTDQDDPFALAELLEKFRLLGVEYLQASEPFSAGGRELPAGTFVVPTAQAFGGFVKTLMERQIYPDLREKTHLWQGIPRRIEVGGGPLRPYDVAGWTLPLQLGLDAVEVERPASDLPLVEAGPFTPWSARGGEPVILDSSNGASWMIVNRLMGLGFEAARETGGEGRFVLDAGAPELTEVLMALGEGSMAVIGETQTMPDPETLRPLRPFRVAVYRPWQSNMDEGWLRWILEHYEFPVTELRNERVREGDLGQEFDLIVIPSMRSQSILNGNREGSVPPDYVGGIGTDGLEVLRQFAAGGGTLFFHDGSVSLALEAFGLPVRVVTDEARQAGFYSAGSILRFDWSEDSPLTRGMGGQGVAFVSSRASLLEITGPGEGPVGAPEVLGAFPHEAPLLESGYLEGEAAILGAPAALAVPYGDGQLVLVGFSLHNRAQMVANFKLLFNAAAEARQGR